MGRIAILPDAVADQIAAGEVVERPASVVKELIENSLDAGATEIRVEVEGGGRTLIVVSDDGSGMDRDDAVLSVDRHATSKLRSAADLVGVATYGFRGEALAAIASVSRFELETAPRGSDAESTRIRVDGGRLSSVESGARQPGTTVAVRRIFFNAPARRKFLRSQAAETRAVIQTVTVLALARLDVSFHMTSDGRTLLDAPRVAETGDRLASLFGSELVGTLIPVDHSFGSVSVRGFIQRPADAKPAGRKSFLFVNGRPFRDPFLVRSAEAGYRATIAPGCKPTVVLSLGVPGDAVDVNVHPAKLEVRFRDRALVERTVEHAVREVLGGVESAAIVGPTGGFPGDVRPYGGVGWDDRPFSGTGAAGDASLFDVAGQEERSGSVQPVQAPGRLLQIFNTYILRETPDGLAFIDQHSAHERVLYEEAMGRLTDGGAVAQRLLLPLTVELIPDELDAVDAHRDLLEAVGYEVEPFGGRSVVIHAVPNPHPRFDARRCFEELTADLARGRFGGWANRLERFCATYACRAAVKGGQPLEEAEMRALLSRLFACELPPHDVHGRPSIVQLPRVELERRFGRR
jgi:DNA mismatch repair protein MutL